MRLDCKLTTNVAVPNAVYTVWGMDEETGYGPVRWPDTTGIYDNFDTAVALARRAAAVPTVDEVRIFAYVGKEGADLAAHEWQRSIQKWEEWKKANEEEY